MQLSKLIFASAMVALVSFSTGTYAAQPSKAKANTYTEDEFLQAFSGKSRKVISDKLGNPVKKEQAAKPSSANTVVGRMGQDVSSSKPVNVEMWYYNNIVTYAPKKTYKVIEMTFVNDRCMNIAFFNNK
jgi:hypothetical protein